MSDNPQDDSKARTGDLAPAPGVPTDPPASVAPTRAVGGQFLPGDRWDGNSKGKQKGTKNRITMRRLMDEEILREQLSVNAPALLAQAVLMALEGNSIMMRTLLDKLLVTPKSEEETDQSDRSVSITINDLSARPGLQVPTITATKGGHTLTIGQSTAVPPKPALEGTTE